MLVDLHKLPALRFRGQEPAKTPSFFGLGQDRCPSAYKDAKMSLLSQVAFPKVRRVRCP